MGSLRGRNSNLAAGGMPPEVPAAGAQPHIGLEQTDPLDYNVELPLSATYYPMGFPLRIETNAEAVLALADRIWSYWEPAAIEPGKPPLSPATLRIVAEDFDSSLPPVPAMPRGQGHLVSIVHSAENFAVCDLAGSFAFARLTRDVIRNTSYLRYHFLEPIVWLLIDAAHLTPLHASCVALDGRAVVLCGDSGAGKTSLAYACARRGWSYLSDDATHIIRERPAVTVAGRPFHIRFRESARNLFPELNAFNPEKRANGKFDIEVETSRLSLPIALESKASHIVFLDRFESTAPARIDDYSKEHASRRLRDLVCYGDERIRAEQGRTLDRLLNLPILKLTWSALADAETALRALLGDA
jgi:hypothetical protein